MFIDKEKYTAHINDNEKLILMRQLLDKVERVLNTHSIQETDFFDPYERYLAKIFKSPQLVVMIVVHYMRLV